MKRIVGFAMFFMGIGMIIQMFVDKIFWGVCIVLILLISGYNLFMSCKKTK